MAPQHSRVTTVSESDVDTDYVLERASARACVAQKRVTLGLVGIGLAVAVWKIPRQQHAGSLRAGSFIQETEEASAAEGEAIDVTWTVAEASESCDVACASPGGDMECNEAAFGTVVTKEAMDQVVGGAQVHCKHTEEADDSASPRFYNSVFTDITGGTCTWSSTKGKCRTETSSGYHRVCPCSKAARKTRWSLGEAKETCDDICDRLSKQKKVPLECDADELHRVTSSNVMEEVMNKVQPPVKCLAEEDERLQNGPQITGEIAKATTCVFNKLSELTSSCSGEPEHGNRRLCPCKVSNGGTLPPDAREQEAEPPSAAPSAPPSEPLAPLEGTATADVTAVPATGTAPADVTAGQGLWRLGGLDEDCNTACGATQECEGGQFANMDIDQVSRDLSNACTEKWTNDGASGDEWANTPAQCHAESGHCGAATPIGYCALSQEGQAKCSGKPPAGYKRFCPCKSTTAAES